MKNWPDRAEEKRDRVVGDERDLDGPGRLHEQEEHHKRRASGIGNHHQIAAAHPVGNSAGDRAKDHRRKRKRQDDETDGGVGLRDVVVIDRLSNAKQERKVDHAVRGLRDSLRDPQTQKRIVAEHGPERAMLPGT